METPQSAPLPVEQALKMHQATRVVGNKIIRPRCHRRIAFRLTHGRRDHGEFGRKGTAESAARFTVPQFHQFEASHMPEQGAGRLAIAQFSQAVTSVVKSDLVRKNGAQLGDPLYDPPSIVP